MIRFSMMLFFVAWPGLSWAQGHEDPAALAYEGTVQSIKEDLVVVKTDQGPIEVSLTPVTKFELGMNGTSAARADLKVGLFVMLTATKPESGKLVAQTIMIHGGSEGAGAMAEPPAADAHAGHHM